MDINERIKLLENDEINKENLFYNTNVAFGLYQLKDHMKIFNRNCLYEYDRDDYIFTYMGEINEIYPIDTKDNYLDYIFETFNLNHPDDFLGSSLSVGDIIAIKFNDKIFSYCINGLGFTKINNFERK